MERVIKRSDLTRAQWLEFRKQGIGGSDAPIICGVSPWTTARELYEVKTNPDYPERDLGEPGIWGTKLESVIAEEYARRSGRKVRRNNFILRSTEHPFMLADLDREVVGDDENGKRGGVEIKTTGVWMRGNWGDQETESIPKHVIVQVQHYMGVTGFAWFDVPVLIGGNEYRVYHIRRNEELIKTIISYESIFWDCILNKTPPPPDFEHKSTPDLFSKIYPGTDGTVITLPPEAEHWNKVALDAAKTAKEYEKVATVARNHLKYLMGESAVGLLPDGGGYKRKEVKRKGFVVEDTKYIDFRFSKKPIK